MIGNCGEIIFSKFRRDMKKSLLTLAVLGTFAASAQAQVTIGGWMSAAPKYYKVGNVNTAVRTAGQTMAAEYRVDDDTNSRIWFTGKEDLGGGLDAHFFMESRFGGDNGSNATTFGLANGDTFLGLGSTTAGTLDVGRISASTYVQGIVIELDRTGSGNNFGTATVLSDIGAFGMLKSRLNNVIRYKTPSLGGFVGTFAISPSVAEEGKVTSATMAQNNTYADGKFLALGANYTNGPIYANLYYHKLTQEGLSGVSPRPSFLTADQKEMRFSASYKLPIGVKVGLSVDRSTLDNLAAGTVMGVFVPGISAPITTAAQGGGSVKAVGAVSRTAWLIPVQYNMGDHGFYAKLGRAGSLSNWNAAPSGTKSGATYTEFAYDYALSKRTAVGVSLMKLKNDGSGTYQSFGSGSSHNGSGLYAGESVIVGQLNIKHSF
jgi:GBP family porin